jgi:hypothetical protein
LLLDPPSLDRALGDILLEQACCARTVRTYQELEGWPRLPT